jgi:hypothetical protein
VGAPDFLAGRKTDKVTVEHACHKVSQAGAPVENAAVENLSIT